MIHPEESNLMKAAINITLNNNHIINITLFLLQVAILVTTLKTRINKESIGTRIRKWHTQRYYLFPMDLYSIYR